MIKNNIKWEKPACDNCGNNNPGIYLDGITNWEYPGEFSLVKCSHCGLIFLFPRPKKEFIGRYYSTRSYWGRDLTYYIVKERNWQKTRDLKYGNIYHYLLKQVKKGCILDVGAGTGEFLTRFSEAGWKTSGVELSKVAAKFAKRSYQIRLIPADFNNINVPVNSFDVITFNSSLEHLYSPRHALLKAFKILKKGGILVITVPNCESLGSKIFGKNWLGYHPPKHLYHFSENTLVSLIQNAGFTVKKVDYWFWEHSYYSLFQSVRYLFSPRFRKARLGGSRCKFTDKIEGKSGGLVKNTVGKLAASLFAASISVLGSVVGRGEAITVYAKKA